LFVRHTGDRSLPFTLHAAPLETPPFAISKWCRGH
jgi:hypothetical protein